MKKFNLILVFFLFSLTKTLAGHHFESDLATKFPQLDLTDIFVFKSLTPNKTVFIMAFNPKSEKNSFANYATNGIYRFNIGSDKDFSKGLSPTFTFKDQKIQFYIENKAEPKINKKGKFIGEGPINKKIEFSNGINLWTGTVYDLFQGNAKGLSLFRDNAKEGIYDLNVFNIGEEGNVFSMLLSTVIVLEMPNEMIPDKMYYYASTAVEEEHNHWHRVNRIAYVLFPHLYLLDNEEKYKYLNSFHGKEPDVKESIYNNVLNYVTIASLQKDPVAYTTNFVNKIYPDVMTYETNTDAVYSVFKINGRPLEADAMDVALALLVGSDTPIDDKVSINLSRFQKSFPYVVPIDDIAIKFKNSVVKVKSRRIKSNNN